MAQTAPSLPGHSTSPEQLLMAAFAEADAGGAEDVATEIAVHQAVIAYQQQDYQRALQLLQASGSGRMAARYFQAASLIHLNRLDEASPIITELQNDPNVPEMVDVGIALALLDSGHREEGIALLEQYTVRHPEDTAAADALLRVREPMASGAAPPVTSSAPASEACMPLPVAQQPRNWNLTFLNGYEYDSNVVRAPEFQGLGSGFQHEDSSWITAAFGDYRFVQDEDLVVGVIGSVFYANRFELSSFDTFNAVGGTYFNRAVGDFILGMNYQFQETLLGGNQFAAEHRLVGNASYLEGNFGHTTAYYEFDAADVDAPALIPAQLRSGRVNAVGFTQAVYLFEGAGRLFAGYRFAQNNADGDDFDFDSHMVTGRVEVPVNGIGWLANWIADAEVRVFFDRYDNPNSLDFFGRTRSDDRVEVRSGVQKFLTEHVSLRVDYTFVNSDSNVSNLFGVNFYDFARHAVTSQIIYDF